MKKNAILLCLVALMSFGAGAFGADSPRWIRKNCISPDGKTIAFSWKGDIWTVPVSGGSASRITSNPAYETDPLWTPDGSGIVFSSWRELSKDVWLIPSKGGKAVRLTDYPGSETPLAVSPGGEVFFTAGIQDNPAYCDFPGTPQIYSVPLAGGRPVQISSIPMSGVSVNAAGIILYEDFKGYEDPLRKHHTSSVTRDIWEYNPVAGSFRKLSTFEGEDRNPVFAPDGRTYYYISEADGCLNVWKGSLDGGEDSQISRLKVHPVRFLSVASDGTLCFSWNGDLYTMREGSEPVKVAVSIEADDNERELIRQSANNISDIAASPNGKELALISRGDVYVTSTEAKSTRRITDTPQRERWLSFNEDGRELYYSSERDGEWAVWKTSLSDKEDKYFSMTYAFKEERVTPKGQTCTQPDVSPDGKWLAYLRDRSDIVVMNIKTGEVKYLLKGVNYSYSDGDLEFRWSPDSRSILTDYMADGGWNNTDVALIDVESGKITNLTRSGYSDGGFRWAMGGKAMTWTSDKAGYRSHGSWGSDRDIYAMVFDGKTWNEFTRSKNEDDIDKLLKEGDKKAEREAKKEKKDSVKAAEKHKVEAVNLDLVNIDDRIVRLTGTSGRLGSHFLTNDGAKLYYVFNGDLCCLEVKQKSSKVLQKGFSGGFNVAPDGKSVYVLGRSGISRLDVASGSIKKIETASAEWDYRPAEERAYIFEHCWKQVDEKFYDPAIHGLDWKAMHDNYKQFLPSISNNFDFQDLLSEMLGELNGSHTGGRYRFSTPGAPNAGHVGVLFDMDYSGKGVKIAEILPGSMLAAVDPDVKAGDVIVAVNGRELSEGVTWYKALENTVGKRTQLGIRRGGKTVDVSLTPSGSDASALYKRWVRQREQMVERLSGGRIGYVHVQSMDSDSFREVYSKALGKYRSCDALIVDTRHNGGGWLHGDLVDLLGGKAYVEYRPRGQYIGSDPYDKWNKPSCVLVGEDNYSDACGFPYAYRALGIGKLIGAPVPGTMTAVWWETQVDPTLVFGVPQVTTWALKEDRPLENFQIEPDIKVYNTPEAVLKGEDTQLERAVEEMMKVL